MTPLVLLPGMMCDARLFVPQIAAFSRERAVMVAPLTGQPTIGALAHQVLAAAPHKFALAGLSMGGIVAMEIARQAPERLDRLALLDTNPMADTDETFAMREHYVAQINAGMLAAVMREELKPRYLSEGPRRAQILDLCMEMAVDLGEDVFIDQTRALQNRMDQQETLKAVSVPSLVLCGEADALCPIERHELMAELIPNSELVVVPGAGHLPTLEQPDETNKALASWLTK